MKKKKYHSPIMVEIALSNIVLLTGSGEQINMGVNNPDEEVDAEYAL